MLDEIGEIPLHLQAKLLRVLQEEEVDRLGGKAPMKLDVRVLATTNRELDAAVKELRPLKADPEVKIPLSAGVSITITELTDKQVKCILEGDRVDFVKVEFFSKDGRQLESGALSSSTIGGKTRRTYSPRGGSVEGGSALVSYPTSEMALEIPLELEEIPLP